MGLFDKVMDFINKQRIKAEKDNVLVSAINQIMQEDLGWRPKRLSFGVDKHELEYYKPDSPLSELDIEAERSGGKLYLKFEGELKFGGALGDLLEDLFDVDLEKEIKYHIVLNLSDFVNDNLELINEEELRRILVSYVASIEERAKNYTS